MVQMEINQSFGRTTQAYFEISRNYDQINEGERNRVRGETVQGMRRRNPKLERVAKDLEATYLMFSHKV
jgi:hypothetical protein